MIDSIGFERTMLSFNILTKPERYLQMFYHVSAFITYVTLGLIWAVPVFDMERTLILAGIDALLSGRWYYILANYARDCRKELLRITESKQVDI